MERNDTIVELCGIKWHNRGTQWDKKACFWNKDPSCWNTKAQFFEYNGIVEIWNYRAAGIKDRYQTAVLFLCPPAGKVVRKAQAEEAV